MGVKKSTDIKMDVESAFISINGQEPQELRFRKNSNCSFVSNRIEVGGYDVQFRLDWQDSDHAGSPTLDADFYERGTDNPVKRQKNSPEWHAHHTKPSHCDGGRCYEWRYSVHNFTFKVTVKWLGYGDLVCETFCWACPTVTRAEDVD